VRPQAGGKGSIQHHNIKSKVLVFYLAVLPHFLGPHPSLLAFVALALSHAALSLLYLLLSSPV
jgi:threonine/homoserine/homoserine lactone efflux protein